MSEEATPPQSKSIGSSIKEGFKSVGQAIDAGVSGLFKEMGQNLRATCPNCHKLILTPPNELVQCPLCSHQFHSPTVSTRTGQVSKSVTEDIKDAWSTHGPSKGTQGTQSATPPPAPREAGA